MLGNELQSRVLDAFSTVSLVGRSAALAVVAATSSRRAAAATTSTGSAFTYGVLVAHELAAAASTRAELNREAA